MIIDKFKFGKEEVFFVSFGYVFFFFLTFFIIEPAQRALFPGMSLVASFIFLPHGIRVVSVWIFGRSALIPLFIGHSIVYAIFFGSPGVIWATGGLTTAVSLILIGTFCAFLALALFKSVASTYR